MVSSPATDNEMGAVISEGAVYGVPVAYDASTGASLWQYTTDLGGFNTSLYPSPVVVNGMIYVSLVGSPDQVGAFSLPNQ